MGYDAHPSAERAPDANPQRAFDRSAIPDLPGGVVPRPRLFELLNAALDQPLLTVTGPAGWGKTQLLSSWVQSPQCPVKAAWLSVDRSDADPQLFWPAVMTALSRAKYGAASHERPVDSFAPIAEALLGVDQDLVLVLDDVHNLQDSQVVSGLGNLIKILPPRVSIVLSGQYLPELPIARLRVEGKVTAITGRDLAFTATEAEQMLSMAGSEIPSHIVAALCERTEGWSAGLRLAALSLTDGLSPSEILTQFGGDHVEVADYLLSEVIARLPADIDDFLLRTSLCDRISGELAALLTGREDSAEVLRWMSRHNVFISSDGPRQTWFRYHTMLSELLRSRLSELGTDEVARLHRVAAGWFAEHQMTIEAVDHAALASDWATAAKVLQDSWLSMYLDGKLVTLAELIDRLPPDVVERHGITHVRVAVGLALGDSALSPGDRSLTGADFEAYAARSGATATPLGASEDSVDEGILSDVDRRLAPNSVPELVVQLERARLGGDLVAAVSAARRLVSPVEGDDWSKWEDSADLRALAFLQLGMTEYWAGHRSEAEAHLREALAQTPGGGRGYVRLGCLAQLVLVLTLQNRLTDALTESDAALQLIGDKGLEFTGAAAELWHALGWVAYLRGDLDRAEKHLTQASLAARRQDAAVTATVLLVQGLVAALRDHKREALARVDEAAQVMSRLRGRYVFDDYVIGERARLRVAVGDLGGAHAVLRDFPEDPAGAIHLSLAHAELYVAEGHLESAIRLLRGTVNEGKGIVDQRLQAVVLLAILLGRTGDERAARDTICDALRLAAPERYVQPFLQFGAQALPLLAAVADNPRVDPTLVRTVQETATQLWPVEPSAPGPVMSRLLPEPLTEREMEVLRSLDSLSSLPEISDSLYVSVNTTKAHLRSVYRKLEVSSRREAVLKARSLGLM